MVIFLGKKVLAAGCFDLLHYGHLKYLEEEGYLAKRGATWVSFRDHL
jgi:glycerol-3-phosphate cytidylyltransferase-like family protein